MLAPLQSAIAIGPILAKLWGIPVAKAVALKGCKILLNSDGFVVEFAAGILCCASRNS